MIKENNMKTDMKNYVLVCPHCGKPLNSFLRGNFRGRYLNKKLDTFKGRYFCTEECYSVYKNQFIVEMYNNQPIYCVEIDGEKQYLPYFEANYYFQNIDDCKKRMDIKGVSVVNDAVLKFMWAQQF